LTRDSGHKASDHHYHVHQNICRPINYDALLLRQIPQYNNLHNLFYTVKIHKLVSFTDNQSQVDVYK